MRRARALHRIRTGPQSELRSLSLGLRTHRDLPGLRIYFASVVVGPIQVPSPSGALSVPVRRAYSGHGAYVVVRAEIRCDPETG